MAKSDAKLTQIDLESTTQNQHSPTWKGSKLINAFDTETNEGTVFMLSYAIGDDSGYIANESIEELDHKELFNKITDYKCRSAINIWYNLDFDANAILSGVLSKRELTQLNVTNGTTTEIGGLEYDIRYVKGKFLNIRDEHGNQYPHYDISQFFYMSLDEAAEQWLGKNKTEGIDTKQFSDKDYIRDNWELICKYAIKDANLTQELGQELITQAEDLDIPMGKPISTGYLSAEYLRANTEAKPKFCNQQMQSMFWDSYYGGRFEVFKRGNIGEIAAPDINSAYPAIMKDLPNPNTLDWERKVNDNENDSFSFSANPFDIDDMKKADYGVVRVKVTTNPKAKIQPFAQKIGGKVKYPVITDKEITVLLPIFLFAVKHDLVVDYDLYEAWLGYENENTEYPFKFIGDMYAQRKVFEQLHGKVKKGKLLKIVLNSLYGKTCQTTDMKKLIELDEGETYELEENESLQPKEYISQNERKKLKDNEYIIAQRFGGKRFNPFFASYITGMTRLELHKQVVEHDLVENTVMFATDCLMIEREAYEESNFDELINVPDSELPEDEFRQVAKESLGYWDFDYKGSAFVVGSGVYEVEMGDYTKTKTRGYNERGIEGTLKDMARKNPEGIPIETNRPLTIAEVLIDPQRGNVSQFINPEKTLSPNFDTKRNWEYENPTFTDLLNMVDDSSPINLIEEQEQRLKEALDNQHLNNEDYPVNPHTVEI